MILFTAFLCKMMLLAAAMIATIYLLRKQMPVKRAAMLACLLVPLAAAANCVSGLAPNLTDEVSLLALNEKNGSSLACEIVIDGFRIDGKDYSVDGVADGKWFWRGSQYMWRAETDLRQPAGTTRQVTLKIPVGWDRQILFSANEYRGVVEIVTEHGVERVDTAETASVWIGRSSAEVLIANQIVHLAAYSLVLFAAAAYLLLCVKGALRTALNHQSDSLFYAALLGICGISFIIMIVIGGGESFWRDEMSLIAYITSTDSILTAMKTDFNWPPIWKGIMFIWYRLVPYGERWLRLPAELCTAGGIWLVGLSGRKLGNWRTGIIAALLAAFVILPWKRVSLDITSYGLLFLLVSAVTYLYLMRTLSKAPYSMKQQLLFTFVMLAAAYTHYFGFFLCGALFLIDCFLIVKKQISSKYIISYIAASVLYSPWIYFVIAEGKVVNSGYWQPEPALKDIPGILRALTGNISILFYICLLGLVIAIAQRVFQKKSDVTQPHSVCLPGFVAAVPVIMFTCVFLYGKYIAIGNTFWVDTYFFVLAPCIVLICTVTIEQSYLYLKAAPGEQAKIISSSILIVLLIAMGANSLDQKETGALKTRDPYREYAEWIYSQGNDVWSDDVLIIFGTRTEAQRLGWMEYYVEQCGKRDALNIESRFISKEKLLSYDKVFLMCINHYEMTADERVMQWLSESYSVSSEIKNMKTTVYVKNT